MSKALRIAHGQFGRVALLDMDRPLVRHAHPHCHVLLKVEGGDTQFLVDDTVYPLTDEAAVLVNGWQAHAYVHDPARPRSVILALYVEPEWLRLFGAGWVASGSPGFFQRPSGEVTPHIRRLTMDLAAEMLARPDASATHETLLSELMIAVISRFAGLDTARSTVGVRGPRAPDWRIRKAVATMRADPGRTADIEAIAGRAGLSRAHFFRLFESSVGVPPKVYLNVVRMERAVTAVLEQRSPLADISAQLGFANPAHFSRFFRNHAGVNPRDFRLVSRLGV